VGLLSNEAAGGAAKDTAMNGYPTTYLVVVDDVRSCLLRAIYSSWKDDWSNVLDNTLRDIKLTVRVWSSFRPAQREVIVKRLRIGHTRLKHGYLLREQQPPTCKSCATTLTVAHILVYCPLYEHVRRQFNINGHIADVLGDVCIWISSILAFLSDIDLAKLIQFPILK
jgi:hypothetical protein